MNRDIERSRALEQFGYTPRQARFLLFVALHGGYFLRRQYVAFTGCAHGQAAVRLITTTTARAHVRALPYGRQGHVFHLCARPVYAAIGQEHNRNRRPAEWSAVIRKLMTLDFVLAHCVARFWATEEDKIALLRELGLRPDIWPAKRYAPRRPGGPMTTRYFVDKMPWFRLPADERLWFTSVDGECTLKGFDTFLLQYRNLLAATPSGVIYVGTGTWPGPVEQVFRTRFVQPFGPRSLSELAFIDYCRLRREVEAGRFANLTINDLGRFRDARPKFASSVFDELYARWLRDGDGAVSSDHVSAREATTAPALSVHRLPFTYGQGPSHRSVPDGKRG